MDTDDLKCCQSPGDVEMEQSFDVKVLPIPLTYEGCREDRLHETRSRLQGSGYFTPWLGWLPVAGIVSRGSALVRSACSPSTSILTAYQDFSKGNYIGVGGGYCRRSALGEVEGNRC
jgi:hypothetical protein